IDQRGHGRELLANQAEISDGLAERFALLGVFNCILQRSARAAHAPGAQLEAAKIQDIESDDVAFADFSEQVIGWYFAVVQDQRTGGRAANAHLVLFRADRKTGEAALDDERGEFFAVNFGEDDEEIS